MGADYYWPYVKVTGTSSFVTPEAPKPCRQQTGRLESFFQVEEEAGRTESINNRGEVRFVRNGRSQRDEFDHRYSMVPDYELTGQELSARYPLASGPAAYCVANAKRGPTALCINRTEYTAIVDRSRNCDPDCKVLHLLWKCPQLFDGRVRPKPEGSETETECKSTSIKAQADPATKKQKPKKKTLSSGRLNFNQPTLRPLRPRRQTCPSDCAVRRPTCPSDCTVRRPTCPSDCAVRRPTCPSDCAVRRPTCPSDCAVRRPTCSSYCAATNRLVQRRSTCSIGPSTKNSGLRCALPPLKDRCRGVEFRERPCGDTSVCCPCRPIDDWSSVNCDDRYSSPPNQCTTRTDCPRTACSCCNDDTHNLNETTCGCQ